MQARAPTTIFTRYSFHLLNNRAERIFAARKESGQPQFGKIQRHNILLKMLPYLHSLKQQRPQSCVETVSVGVISQFLTLTLPNTQSFGEDSG